MAYGFESHLSYHINKKKLYYVPYCGVIYKLVAEFIWGEILVSLTLDILLNESKMFLVCGTLLPFTPDLPVVLIP